MLIPNQVNQTHLTHEEAIFGGFVGVIVYPESNKTFGRLARPPNSRESTSNGPRHNTDRQKIMNVQVQVQQPERPTRKSEAEGCKYREASREKTTSVTLTKF